MKSHETNFRPNLDLGDLTGPDGNSFVIMSKVARAMRLCLCSERRIQKYVREATSGDYENLLAVTRKYCVVAENTGDKNE